MHADADVPRRVSADGDVSTRGISKVDAVFKSGNATRDTIPSHLVANADVPPEVARFYAHLCPAGVYELTDGQLRINAPNCVDCKATDVLGRAGRPGRAAADQAKRM